jgi:hypothetical protein
MTLKTKLGQASQRRLAMAMSPANWPELESEDVSRETEWDVIEPVRRKIEALHREESQ